MMSDEELQRFYERAAHDKAFREALWNDRDGTIDSTDLAPHVKAMLKSVTPEQLAVMVRKATGMKLVRWGMTIKAGLGLVVVAVLVGLLLPPCARRDTPVETRAATNERAVAEEDESTDSPVQPEATPASVDKALVRYLKVSGDSYAPGYLGADGVFYKFKDAEPVKASELLAGLEKEQWRVVQGDHKTVEIKRPERLQFASWKDGTHRAACWTEDRATLLVFTGFRPIRVEEIPWALGPISRTSPLQPDKLDCKIVEIKGPDDAGKANGEAGETAEK